MTTDSDEPEHDVHKFTMIDLFRGRPNDPVVALTVLHSLMLQDGEIPEDLRQWFTKRLALTLDSGGEISLDKAFGLSRIAGQHNAFTDSDRYFKQLALIEEMHHLVCVCRFSASVASRLIFERDTYYWESSPESHRIPVKSAESIRTKYSLEKDSLGLIERYCFSEFDLAYLNKFDVAQQAPPDREALRLAISRVKKAIQSV